MSTNENTRPPSPPFKFDTATQKVRLAEDAWNSKDPVKVSLAYTSESVWRNRSDFLTGRQEIIEFLTKKWNKELNYRLIKSYGHLQKIKFRYGLRMNGKMSSENGFVLMAMKIGNLMKAVICKKESQVSMIYQF
jgi:nuclear transport factor 2 (NTF2) superfamily protein